MVLPGHTGRLAALVYSPVGERLASIAVDLERLSHNGEVKVWDTTSGRELWTARINASGVRKGTRWPWPSTRTGGDWRSRIWMEIRTGSVTSRSVTPRPGKNDS
jgi:hypothetical protein